MLVAETVRTTCNRRPCGKTTVLSGTLILAIVGCVGCNARSTASMLHPVSLNITYRDKEIIQGAGGDSHSGTGTHVFGEGMELHEGTATYVFKNQLPIPVKIVFPPIGYASGGFVPITPQCCDATNMPEFCRTAQVVEFAPGAERRFTSKYAIASARGAAPPVERFVFGPAADREQKGVLVDCVESAGKFEKAESTDAKGGGRTR